MFMIACNLPAEIPSNSLLITLDLRIPEYNSHARYTALQLKKIALKLDTPWILPGYYNRYSEYCILDNRHSRLATRTLSLRALRRIVRTRRQRRWDGRLHVASSRRPVPECASKHCQYRLNEPRSALDDKPRPTCWPRFAVSQPSLWRSL